RRDSLTRPKRAYPVSAPRLSRTLHRGFVSVARRWRSSRGAVSLLGAKIRLAFARQCPHSCHTNGLSCLTHLVAVLPGSGTSDRPRPRHGFARCFQITLLFRLRPATWQSAPPCPRGGMPPANHIQVLHPASCRRIPSSPCCNIRYGHPLMSTMTSREWYRSQAEAPVRSFADR